MRRYPAEEADVLKYVRVDSFPYPFLIDELQSWKLLCQPPWPHKRKEVRQDERPTTSRKRYISVSVRQINSFTYIQERR